MIKRIIYEWLISEFKVGTSYTNEHLEIVAEAFKIRYGENWAITTNKIAEILNQTYNIESFQTKKCNPLEISFYRNINPNGLHKDKRIKFNTVKSEIKVQDIKKELEGTSSDLSIELSIQRRKDKILNQLDTFEKEMLLEGIF